jgi:uncharacterized protein (TIGR02145 family)
MLSPILDFSRRDPKKGTLFDTRDGQSYPVIRINNQIWLAENFRYLPSIEKGDEFCNSWISDNSYLDKGYGRFYDWNTARNIALEGWRLPSNEDFQELRDFIIKDNSIFSHEVGSYLKSINGWELRVGVVNTDKYEFNAKPAGYHSGIDFDKLYQSYYSVESSMYLWSDTEYNSSNADSWCLHFFSEGFYYSRCNNKENGFSVRLIKDS